ncbi:MAG: hypothetical protein KJ050_00360 [Candidatus Omnitrophica bacterium]|nr:hypothetical protein [Candidatus Omnitrophota bacterium]MCL4733357.1 hypothetical protein [Candidatus Omnitrophota bacterium]
MVEKKRYDMDSPEARAVIDEIVHGTFTIEGTFVAFPLCFPGASQPIPPDESRIVSLDISREGMIYGGTEGHCVHLFVGMFHGVTGMVFDLARIENAQACIGVHCGPESVVAVVHGTGGSRIVSVPHQSLPFDLIQEWGFEKPVLSDVYRFPEGEKAVHSYCEADREHLLCLTDQGAVRIHIPTSKRTEIEAPEGLSRPGGLQSGKVVAIGPDRSIWEYEPASSRFRKSEVLLPDDFTVGEKICWLHGSSREATFVADSDGRIYRLSEGSSTLEFSKSLGQTRHKPVTALAETHDGRLYGFGGDGISRFWRFSPRSGELKDLGVAVSILQQRRYGYEFSPAVVGRDGQIFFGENDQGGHLWIYFPKVERV